MIEQGARAGIHVWPGVFDLVLLFEDGWNDDREPVHDAKNVIFGGDSRSELVNGCKARVGNPEHGVAVARNDATIMQSFQHELPKLVIGRGAFVAVVYREDEVQYLLVGKAVQRAGEPAHPRGDRIVG